MWDGKCDGRADYRQSRLKQGKARFNAHADNANVQRMTTAQGSAGTWRANLLLFLILRRAVAVPVWGGGAVALC